MFYPYKFKVIQQLSVSKKYFSSKYRIMKLPRLSPSMTQGSIIKWHISENQVVKSYDLALEVSTSSLTMHSKEISVLDIEILEDSLRVVKLLQHENTLVNADSPIAILCDDDIATEEIISFKNLKLESLTPTMWQAYIKGKNDPGSCGCS